MEINLDEIVRVLRELSRRDCEKKGMQPEMVLNCFINKKRSDDGCCVECLHYESKCRGYIQIFRL